MKVLVNGGLNLSELDGWWAEAYSRDLGWSIGDGAEHDHDSSWDAVEANELYRVLEEEVIPVFYDRSDEGISVRWVSRMRESMARLAPLFSANRAIREYTESYYLPAARAFNERIRDRGAAGLSIVRSQQNLASRWATIRFMEARAETSGGRHRFSVRVCLGELTPEMVRVQLYSDVRDGRVASCEEMRPERQITGASNEFVYSAEIGAERPAEEYTPRIVPSATVGNTPLEDVHILWMR